MKTLKPTLLMIAISFVVICRCDKVYDILCPCIENEFKSAQIPIDGCSVLYYYGPSFNLDLKTREVATVLFVKCFVEKCNCLKRQLPTVRDCTGMMNKLRMSKYGPFLEQLQVNSAYNKCL